jgi:hypothetical protein
MEPEKLKSFATILDLSGTVEDIAQVIDSPIKEVGCLQAFHTNTTQTKTLHSQTNQQHYLYYTMQFIMKNKYLILGGLLGFLFLMTVFNVRNRIRSEEYKEGVVNTAELLKHKAEHLAHDTIQKTAHTVKEAGERVLHFATDPKGVQKRP